MQFDGVHLHHAHQRGFAADFEQRGVAGVERGVEQGDAGERAAFHVLLEELLAAHAVGRAQQGNGALGEVRQDERCDGGVVARQTELGGAAGGVDDALGVGDGLASQHGGAVGLGCCCY